MGSITYQCTALVGTNKTGELKPDENGYYTVVLGALDHFNSMGQFYEFEESKKIFEESSTFMRRVKDGAMYAELDHPRMQPGWTVRDFIRRIHDIYQDRICAHISDVVIDSQSVKDENGRFIHAIIGKVKPYGPFGYMVEDALKNPKQNACFSIRSMTDDRVVNGVTRKILKHVTNFDFVTEPGINKAKKWFSPALETLGQSLIITQQMLTSLITDCTHRGLGAESAELSNLKDAAKNLGWDKPSEDNAPIYARW